MLIRSMASPLSASLALILFGLSCTDFGAGTNTTIEGRVSVRIFEGYPLLERPDNPTILLGMQTERIYPCFNYSILADVFSGPGAITVFLKGIHRPEDCLRAVGPATYLKPLPLSPGSHHLVFAHGSASDRFMVEVTTSSIRISPTTATVAVVPSRLVWRIPAKSFAYICGTTAETAWMCDAFRDSLLSIASLREFSFPDSGEIPYPTASTGHWNDTPARYFLYADEADYDSAGAMLRRFAREVIGSNQGISIYLQNWRNVTIRSWTP